MSLSIQTKARLLAGVTLFALSVTSVFAGEVGTTRPQPKYTVEETVTRSEFINGIMSAKYGKNEPQKDCFLDVTASDWDSKHICLAVELGVITGKADGYFRRDDPITVREAITMFQRFYGLKLEDNVSLYNVPLSYAKKMNIVPTAVTNLDAPLTRGTMRDIKSRMENPAQILAKQGELGATVSNASVRSVEARLKAKLSKPVSKYTVEETISRLEFLTGMMGAKYGKNEPQKDCFTDVTAADWYSKHICKAVEMGLISGSTDGYFYTDNPMTVGEAEKVMEGLYGVSFINVTLYNVPASYAKKMNVEQVVITDLNAPLTRGIFRGMKTQLTGLIKAAQ